VHVDAWTAAARFSNVHKNILALIPSAVDKTPRAGSLAAGGAATTG